MSKNFRPGIAVIVMLAGVFVAAAPRVHAQSPENVAVVINDNSSDSRTVGEAYVRARSIPESNVLRIRTSMEETVDRATFTRTIEGPLGAAIARGRLQDRILYLVLTKGTPLRIAGTPGRDGTGASVDSELALLYRRMTGVAVSARGAVANPYFLGDRDVSDARPFSHRLFDIFLVSRLDGYTVADALALIERGMSAHSPGRIVLDQRDATADDIGGRWLQLASKRLTDQGHGDLVVLESTSKAARNVTNVLGYVSWGSTDPQNRVRSSGMTFSPGAVATSFVGTDGRTFREPPPAWVPSGDPVNRSGWYAGSPESLVGDLIRDGVTGAAGYVAQPFFDGTVRPQVLFPAYVAGFNLIEAFYLAMPDLSWQAIVIGDPLCRPFQREPLSQSELDEGFDGDTGLPARFSMRRLAASVAQSPGVPARAIALQLRADLLLSQGDRSGARQAIDDAIALAPRYTVALVQRAGLDEVEGRSDQALETYQLILRIDPNNTIALNNLAYGLAVYRKMPVDALPLAERAAARAPGNPTVLDTLAWVHHLLGDHPRAAAVMERALRTPVTQPEIRMHAAMVFAAVGAHARARQELTAALALNPALAGTNAVQEVQAALAK